MKRFANIIALIPGDPSKSTFTYSFSDSGLDLRPGCLVSIPYGKKEVNGVVENIHDTIPEFETREINSLVYPEPVLPPHLLTLAKWMSSYYFASLRVCVETVLLFRRTVRLRTTVSESVISYQSPPQLYPEQQHAFETVVRSLDTFHSFLLHGITGSGKTEVYLRIIEEVLARGRQVIYLVPEIALTPQTIARVEGRFPGKTSVINSQISDGERYRAFQNIISGQRPIVIGSRSALFAPFYDLGLIIIDECHDSSYKQDSSPYYHTVRVAEELARIRRIPLLLGSATPRLLDYYSAFSGVPDHSLLSLSSRSLNAQLPSVSIVDMREELKKRNFSTFSDLLEDSLKKCLRNHEQAILFLNKRGVASSVVCRMCGWTAECPNCAVALTLHGSLYDLLANKLVCHHCDFMQDMIPQCHSCGSLYIKAMGSGTERIQADLLKLIPDARVIRMDRDTTTQKGSHESIYRSFVHHKFDILIGTQMITKGWDIPNVTLVGVMNADTALHMPTYSAAEQTFSLITQVSGRAGRGSKPGKVVLQTYNPEHYALIAASQHSFESFYTQELAFRKQLIYPPFVQLVQLVISETDEHRAIKKSDQLFSLLLTETANLAYSPNQVQLLGPSSCLVPKLRNKWYYQILIKGKKEHIDSLLAFVPHDWKINVDPEGTL